MEQKIREVLSESAYKRLEDAVKERVGEHAFQYIFPVVVKALEEGDKEVRQEILLEWLDVEFCRVCDVCGNIMQEGWYNCGKYACSDECVMKQDGISKEEFDKFQIYKSTIQNFLIDNAEEYGYPENADDLTPEQIESIIDELLDDCDSYYTEWE